MPFQKGHKLSKGRPEGSSNKATERIKNNFADILERRQRDIDKWFDSIDNPGDKIRYLLSMAEFVMARKKQLDASIEEKTYIIEDPVKPKT